jgi:3-methylfumaryl-CoA hydratase
VPPLGHWLFHLTEVRQSALGVDGHPHTGGFMPPIPLPRRMWAGSRIRFLRNIAVGAQLVRRSRIEKIETKNGTSGEMILVAVRHEIIRDEDVAIEEDQDIVYLGPPGTAPEQRPRTGVPLPVAQITRRCRATPELLFRFSALTFNAHRIHYDRDYARAHEHYRGLVVHGPLLAILLVDHFLRHRPGACVSEFNFRARAPVFDGDAFDLCLTANPTGADLWILGADGQVKMTAQIAATS